MGFLFRVILWITTILIGANYALELDTWLPSSLIKRTSQAKSDIFFVGSPRAVDQWEGGNMVVYSEAYICNGNSRVGILVVAYSLDSFLWKV